MNWKNEAKQELRMYGSLKASIDNIAERMSWIDSQMTSLKSAAAGTTPVQGGGNKYEDRLLDLIVQKQRLKLTLDADKIRLELIERGIAELNETEKTVAMKFAQYRSGEAVEILTGLLYLERAQIYRIWDQALYRYTIAEYGISEF